jgi:hypothetical protein
VEAQALTTVMAAARALQRAHSDARDPGHAVQAVILNPDKSLSAGAHLDPRRVLDALDPEMPLALAADTLAAMMRTALHRRRAGSLSRALHRACHLSAAAERAEVCAGHRLKPTRSSAGVARLPTCVLRLRFSPLARVQPALLTV